MKDSHLSLHPTHLEDLQKSGLSDETIAEAGIYSAPPSEIPKLLGWNPPIESAYVIPYPGKDGFFRMKAFPSYKDKKGHTVKYLQPKNKGPYLYTPPRTEEALEDPTIPLVITEGEKKALKGFQDGFHTIGLGGVWNFLKDGKAIEGLNLINWKGRTVYICFDSDTLEKIEVLKAEYRLAEELKGREAIVRVVRIPSENGQKAGLDDFLVAHGPEALRKLIEEAKEPEKPVIAYGKALINKGRNYELILQYMADIQWEGERDELINYLIKKRTYDKRSIRKDIKRFWKEAILNRPTAEEDRTTFTEEEKAEALKLLQDPALLEKFLSMTERLGLVRERDNRLCLYLALTSRFLRQPISILIQGQSSAGKSILIETILKLFPPEEYLSYSTITPQSLYYLQGRSLSHKILVIFEKSGSEKANYSIRTFISEGKLKILYATKDPKSGEFVSKEIIKDGPIAYLETTSLPKVKVDDETRVFTLFPDESEGKIREVLKQIANECATPKEEAEKEIRIWRCLQTLLHPYRVKNVFGLLVEKYFPAKDVRIQRDFKRFMALVEASCLLHQHQRTKEREDILIADLDDYGIARQIAGTVLAQTLKQLSPRAEELLETIMALKEESGEGEDFTFRRQDLEALNWPGSTMRYYLYALEKRGYLSLVQREKGKPKVYVLDGKVEGQIILPTHKELENEYCILLGNLATPTKTLASTSEEVDKVGFSNPWQPCQPPEDDTSESEPAKLLKVAKDGLSNPETLPDKGKGDTCQVAKESMISKFDDDKDPWDVTPSAKCLTPCPDNYTLRFHPLGKRLIRFCKRKGTFCTFWESKEP